MSSPRKIYVASGAPEKLAFLGKRFTITNDPREADLIIVDVSQAIELAWVRASGHFFAGPCCPPFILTAIGGKKDEVVLNEIKRIFPDLVLGDVYQDPEALEKTLAWMQSILPFQNVQNVTADSSMDRLKVDFLLQKVR